MRESVGNPQQNFVVCVGFWGPGKNVWRGKVCLGSDAGQTKRQLQRSLHGSRRPAEAVLNELSPVGLIAIFGESP